MPVRVDYDDTEESCCYTAMFVLLLPLARVVVGFSLWFDSLLPKHDKPSMIFLAPLMIYVAVVFDDATKDTIGDIGRGILSLMIAMAVAGVELSIFYCLHHIYDKARRDEDNFPTLGDYKRPFNELGVELNVLREFVNHCGGRQALEGLTTSQVCEQFIKPMTQTISDSYCKHLLHQGDTRVLPANIFISHAWKYQFLHVVDAIMSHCTPLEGSLGSSANERCIIWFDLFSNSQWLDEPPPFPWWCHTFSNAIKNIGYTLMIIEPWNRPITLTRAWCLWEIFCTVKTGSKFDIAMCSDEENAFTEMISTDSTLFNEVIACVDVSKSEAFKVEDKERIFEVINKTVGFNKLNMKVVACLRGWFLTKIRRLVELKSTQHLTATESESLLLNIRALSSMYRDSTQYLDADKYAVMYLQIAESLHTRCRHHKVLEALRMIGEIRLLRGKVVEGTRYLQMSVSLYRDNSSPNHVEDALCKVEYLQCIRQLGLAFIQRGDKTGGWSLLDEYEQGLIQQAGDVSVDYYNHIVIKCDLKAQELKDVAPQDENEWVVLETEYRSAHNLLCALLGDDHPHSLKAAHRLGMFMISKPFVSFEGRDEAIQLLNACYEKCRVKLGTDNLDTLNILYDLASIDEKCAQLYSGAGFRYDSDAAAKFKACYHHRRRVLGPDHPLTLETKLRYLVFSDGFWVMLAIGLVATATTALSLYLNASIVSGFKGGTASISGANLSVLVGFAMFLPSIVAASPIIMTLEKKVNIGKMTAACSGWWKVLYAIVYIASNVCFVWSIVSMVCIVDRDRERGARRYMFILYFYLCFCAAGAVAALFQIYFFQKYASQIAVTSELKRKQLKAAYETLYYDDEESEAHSVNRIEIVVNPVTA